MRRRAVHADLAVPVEAHETELEVDVRVDHGHVQRVAVGNCAPVVDRGTAHRVGSDGDSGVADRIHVDHIAQLRDIVVEKVELDRLWLGTLDLTHAAEDDLVGSRGNPVGGIAVGRAAVRRVVLETAIGRRVVARRDDQPVGERGIPRWFAFVVVDDCDRDGRGRNVAVGCVNHGEHVVAGEHFESGAFGWSAERVGVFADVYRAVDVLAAAVFDDCLSDGGDVVFVEAGVQGRAAVTTGAEGYFLLWIGDIRVQFVIEPDQSIDVD